MFSKEIKDISKEIYNENKDKGFWDRPRKFEETSSLIATEISELIECFRHSKYSNLDLFNSAIINDPDKYKEVFENNVKDSLEDELADIAIRCFDYIGSLNVDSDEKPFKYEFNDNDTLVLNENDFYHIMYHNLFKPLFDDTEDYYDRIITVLRNCYKLSESLNIDINTHIKIKREYNKTRAYKHGKNS